MKSAQRARVRVDCQEQKRVGLYWLYCIALNFFLLSYFFSLFSSFVLVLFSFSSCFLCCFFLVVQLQGDECAEGQYTDTLVTNGGCVDCPTGYVSTSNACLALDQKKYRPNVDLLVTEYCKKGHYCDGMNIIPCPPGRSANARQENSCVECDRGKQKFYFGLYGFLFLYRVYNTNCLSFFSSIFSFSTNINSFKVNTVSVLVLRLATNALQHAMPKVVVPRLGE